MIINYPTGLYQNVLDHSNNVTYTISNNAPPRSNTIILKIPQAIVEQIKTPSTVSYDYKRKAAGTLIYTVSKSNRSLAGDNSFQYESGTVLDFDNITTTQVDNVTPDSKIEIQHDSFYSDLQTYGVDAEKVASSALNVYRKLSSDLNSYKKSLFNSQKLIESYQASINELNRSISGLAILLEYDPTIQDSINILNEQLSDYNNKMMAEIEASNNYNALCETTTNKIRSLAAVIR